MLVGWESVSASRQRPAPPHGGWRCADPPYAVPPPAAGHRPRCSAVGIRCSDPSIQNRTTLHVKNDQQPKRPGGPGRRRQPADHHQHRPGHRDGRRNRRHRWGERGPVGHRQRRHGLVRQPLRRVAHRLRHRQQLGRHLRHRRDLPAGGRRRHQRGGSGHLRQRQRHPRDARRRHGHERRQRFRTRQLRGDARRRRLRQEHRLAQGRGGRGPHHGRPGHGGELRPDPGHGR